MPKLGTIFVVCRQGEPGNRPINDERLAVSPKITASSRTNFIGDEQRDITNNVLLHALGRPNVQVVLGIGGSDQCVLRF